VPAAAAWAPDGPPPAGPSPVMLACLVGGAGPAEPAGIAAQGADRDRAGQRGLHEPAGAGSVRDLAGRPGEEPHEDGQASRDMATIAKPVKMVVRFLPVPIIMNATA